MIEDKSSFHLASVQLLREAFEGIPEGASGTWFVQGREGILNSLAELDAQQASYCVNDQIKSIGAHARHLAYILNWGNTCHGEQAPTGSWEDTWLQTTFGDSEWEALKKDISDRYARFLEWYTSNTDWSHEEGVVGVLAMLPHVAFHLGAIRQLMMVLP